MSEITERDLPSSKRFIDYTGKQYGVLAVLSYAGKDQHSNSLWNVRCKCGNEKIFLGPFLAKRNHDRCTCKIGSKLSTTREYQIWRGMKKRCSDEKSTAYERYGGRGIKVCERWELSFDDFLSDMGPRPSAKHSIERKDRDGDYCPENCIWALPVVQARNTSRNFWVTINGESKLIQDWSKLSGVGRTTIIMRIQAGWDHERAVFEPVTKAKQEKASEHAEACVINGCDSTAFCRGLCKRCYQNASVAIREEKTTWAELISLGIATQAKGAGRKLSPFALALDQAKQKDN